MKQDAGVLDLTVFIRPHKLRPFWILVKLQFPSLPAPVFFHERSLLYDPVFSLLSLCVRKCLLVWSVTIYTFNKGLCGVVIGGWAPLWYGEEMSATDRELRERRENKLIPWNCNLTCFYWAMGEEALYVSCVCVTTLPCFVWESPSYCSSPLLSVFLNWFQWWIIKAREILWLFHSASFFPLRNLIRIRERRGRKGNDRGGQKRGGKNTTPPLFTFTEVKFKKWGGIILTWDWVSLEAQNLLTKTMCHFTSGLVYVYGYMFVCDSEGDRGSGFCVEGRCSVLWGRRSSAAVGK